MNSWSHRTLSQGGKEIFIKAILQAIPLYTMSYFLLPKSLCDELSGIIWRYWWRQRPEKKGIHWMCWDKLCTSKTKSGMVFRDMKLFNLALLCKQGWVLLQMSNTLAYQVLKSKYFPNNSFLETKVGTNPSLTWRGICATQNILARGLRWQVGRIWEDRWVPGVHDGLLTEP